MSAARIPVTVITGFLGSGKTTLVNRLMAQFPGLRVGVVVNEYGEVGVDGSLIEADEDAVVELRNGCVCCTVRADLVGCILRLLDRPGPPIDRLIVETSGLADPAPVLQTFLADADLLRRVLLESVVTVVDALHVSLHLDDDIVREQIAFADTIVVNKASLLESGPLQALGERLRQLNPAAVRLQADRACVQGGDVLGTCRFSLGHALSVEPALMEDGEHDHEHDASIASCSFVTDRPLDPQRFDRWIRQLVMRDGADLLRSKGVLALHGEARRFHFHSVHMLVDAAPGKRWAVDESRHSRAVFIGRKLDARALRAGFLSCVQALETQAAA